MDYGVCGRCICDCVCEMEGGTVVLMGTWWRDGDVLWADLDSFMSTRILASWATPDLT
jgi:hypothetical protein